MTSDEAKVKFVTKRLLGTFEVGDTVRHKLDSPANWTSEYDFPIGAEGVINEIDRSGHIWIRKTTKERPWQSVCLMPEWVELIYKGEGQNE